MTDTDSFVRWRGTALRFGIAAALWLALIAVLIYVVPTQKRLFDDFGLALPLVTQVVLDVAMWLNDYWMFAGILISGFLVVLAGVTVLVRHVFKKRILMAVWTLALMAPPLACHVVLCFALLWPRLKLAEGLGR